MCRRIAMEMPDIAQSTVDTASTSLPRRAWSRLALPGAVTMTALSAGLLTAWVVLVLTMPATVPVDDVSGQLIFAVPIVGGGAIAFLLTTRKPGNPVGW